MRFGIELSFIKWNVSDKQKMRAIARRVARKACLDDGALEIPSPVFKNKEQFEKWYDKIHTKLIVPYNLQTHYRTKWEIEGGGGGHVHCEIPKEINFRHAFMNLLRANHEMYFLKWIFGDVCEDGLKLGRCCIPEDYCAKSPSSLITVSYYYPTLEHRYFDAPKNKQEALDFIDFALALSTRIFVPETLSFYSFDYERRNDEGYVLGRWRLLLSQLRLSESRYVCYFDRYLAIKEEFGEVE